MSRGLSWMLSALVLGSSCTQIEPVESSPETAPGVRGAGSGGRAGARGLLARGGSGGIGIAAVPSNSEATAGAAGTDVGSMGEPCSDELASGCGSGGTETLVCTAGTWMVTGQCPENYRCDSTQGDTFGTCLPVINVCATKAAGEPVCDGWTRRRCGADGVRLESFDCPANAHCIEMPELQCACDVNYKDDGAGNCVPDISCPASACIPGGRCVPGATDYSCECDLEYEGTGTKACTLTGICTMVTSCSEDYVCRSKDSSFVCRGQFADWPMPSTITGAKAAPSYMPSADVVLDTVTGLSWQRNVPDMYPTCTAAGCMWMQAVSYCDTLELEGRGWRLPTLIELISILDENRLEPSIDPDAFPSTPPASFWSASRQAMSSNEAWVVNFGSFKADIVNKSSTQRVRCVR